MLEFLSSVFGSPMVGCSAGAAPPLKSPPCDLQRIDLFLTTLGDVHGIGAARAVSDPVHVSNDRRIATPKIAGLPTDDAAAMPLYAAYIHVRAPSEKGEPRTYSSQALATMGPRCARHPELATVDYLGPGDRSAPAELTLSPHKFDLTWWKKAIFKGKLRAAFETLSKSRGFTFVSCGLPVSGPGHPSLDAFVRVTALTDCSIRLGIASGLVFKIGRTRTATRAGGALVRQDTHSRTIGAREEKLSVTAGSIDGKLDFSVTEQDGEIVEPASWDRGDSENALIQTTKKQLGFTADDRRRAQDEEEAHAVEEARREHYFGQPTNDTPEDAFPRVRAILRSEAMKKLSLSLRVNDVELSRQSLVDVVESVVDAVSEVTEAASLLVMALRDGLKKGMPYSVSFGFSMEATLLKGDLSAHWWSEVKPAITGPGYHVIPSQDRFAFGVKMTLAEVTGTIFASAAVGIICRQIAGAELKIEATVTGAFEISTEVSDSSGPTTAGFEAPLTVLIKISAEGNAGTAYFTGEAEATTGVTYAKSWNYAAGAFTKDQDKSRIEYDEVAWHVECQAGLVRREFKLEGEAGYSWRYPRKGELIMLEANTVPW